MVQVRCRRISWRTNLAFQIGCSEKKHAYPHVVGRQTNEQTLAIQHDTYSNSLEMIFYFVQTRKRVHNLTIRKSQLMMPPPISKSPW